MSKKHTILLVDDEADIRTALGGELASNGYEVLTAGDGTEAIKTLSQRKVDVVLLDVVMPKSNGFDVLDFIKRNSIESKVIMMSASADLSDVYRSKLLEARDYIPKPYSVEDVLNAISRVLS
jgi:DNA-binding NtrC family response regulator